MNYCPLCGSPAVEWPSFASDYVRGYHLCEWHMRAAMRAAHVQEYNSREHMAVKKYNRIAKEIWDIADKILEKYDADESLFIDGYVDDSHGYRWCSIAGELREKLDIEDKPLENPSKEYISEQDVDRWLSNRLKLLASNSDGRIHRCSGFRKESTDQRCIATVSKEGEMCSLCTKAGVRAINERFENTRLGVALDFLRTGKPMVTRAS